MKNFNDYEKLLIQHAKAFQVMTKMGTVSGKENLKNIQNKNVGQATVDKLPSP